jgi:hypothetical protein
VQNCLVEIGGLRREDRRVLRVFPVHRTRESDGRLHHELIDHLRDAIVLGRDPMQETAALASLALAVGLDRHLFPRSDRLAVANAASLPVFEGVVACLLTAMSLLAFLGLRYPIRMLPILLFEVLWKVIWIAAVALPHLVADDINAATREVLVNCSLVVIIIAVIPWPYVWRRYVRAPADAWR